MVGGVAVRRYVGPCRATDDLDIVIDQSSTPGGRIKWAISRMTETCGGMPEPNVITDTPAFRVATDHGVLHAMLPLPPAVPLPAREIVRRARRAWLYGVRAPVIAIEDLCAMKEVEPRPRDIDDLALLRHAMGGST